MDDVVKWVVIAAWVGPSLWVAKTWPLAYITAKRMGNI